MRIIECVIFDLDGVIVSTDEQHYQAWKTIADDQGLYFDRQMNHRLRGVSRMESLDIIIGKDSYRYSDEEKRELADRKNALYVSSLSTLGKNDLLPGALETMSKLRSMGFRIAIGSSSKNARLILRRLGLESNFDAISDGTNITHSKPHPEVFIKAAEFLAIPPEKCAVVEDAHSGIDAAKSAGMLAIGIGKASGYDKADFSVKSLREVCSVVARVHKRNK